MMLLIFLVTLICLTIGNEARCSYEYEGKFANCEGLTDFNALSNTIKYLIIRNSGNLTFTENFHKKLPILTLISYTIKDNSNLDIDRYAFNFLAELTTLTISNNSWNVIKENTFEGIPKLRYLEIINNNVHKLENGCFNGLTKLEMLVLEKNALQKIPSTIFHGLEYLEKISLVSNRIETLEDNTFQNLTKLRELRLSKNSLTVIKSATFNNLQALTTLDLNENKIKSIKGQLNLPSLKFLNLSKNNLKIIITEFSALHNLLDLDISYNDIEEINANAFTDLSNLKSINCVHNKFTSKLNLTFQSNKPLIIC